jgi:hypothetical protein
MPHTDRCSSRFLTLNIGCSGSPEIGAPRAGAANAEVLFPDYTILNGGFKLEEYLRSLDIGGQLLKSV